MSVVLISPFFHPEAISTGRYNTILAQGLVRHGQAVAVIASHPLYPAWQPDRSSVQLPGMHIRRGGGWLKYPGKPVLRRMLLESWFAIFANLQLARLRHSAKRIVVIFPPNLVATTLRLLLPKYTPIVGVVHDLQGVMAQRGDSALGRLLTRIILAIEGRAFRNCDRLIFLSHSMAERAIAVYGIARDRCAIHYPFLTLPATAPTVSDRLVAALPDGHTHVVYSGALGEKQNPDRLVWLMRELRARHANVRCSIFSAGPNFERLRAQPQPDVETRIQFQNLVPDDTLDELYARSTVQLLPQASGTSDGAIPSKLPNLLAAGVPIFAICDSQSEIVRVLKQAGDASGDHVSDFDAPSLHAQFERLLQQIARDPRATRVARQRPQVERMFSVEPLIAEILSA